MHQRSSPLEEVLVVVLVVVVTTASLEEQLERRFCNVHQRKRRGVAAVGVFAAAILACRCIRLTLGFMAEPWDYSHGQLLQYVSPSKKEEYVG
eukprot:11782810-Ditylum_brightwellii.AAC.1